MSAVSAVGDGESDADVDVLVAGGGPVGLAAALGVRAAGLTVAVIEPRSTPVDKACGEGLMPAAVLELNRLGVAIDGRAFVGIRYLAPGRSAAARFRAGPGLGVRRTTLHEALQERSERAGVERVVASVGTVEQDGSGVTAAGLRARWLLAADGLHSGVRRELGLDVAARPGTPSRFGLRRHLEIAPWSPYVEVHWGPRSEAYITPVSESLVGVAILTGRQGRTFDDLLSDFPDLQDRLAGAPAATSVRGAGPLRQIARTQQLGRVLLIGDAAGYHDALTGEGIAVGLATAREAVASIVAGRPQAYPAAWSRVTRRYRWSSSALLGATQRPWVRRSLVPAAAALPRVFSLAVNHVA